MVGQPNFIVFLLLGQVEDELDRDSLHDFSSESVLTAESPFLRHGLLILYACCV